MLEVLRLAVTVTFFCMLFAGVVGRCFLTCDIPNKCGKLDRWSHLLSLSYFVLLINRTPGAHETHMTLKLVGSY